MVNKKLMMCKKMTGFVNTQEDTNQDCSPQLIHAKPLHFNRFVVTTSIIEWITAFREIIKYIARVQHRNPIAVMP